MVIDSSVFTPQVAHKNTPYVGEEFSGDKVVMYQDSERMLLAIIDGLGHGPSAHQMSKFIAEKLNTLSHSLSPDDMLNALNQCCTPSIIAAVGIGVVDKRQQTFTFSAIGNISAYILSHNSFAYVSRDGSIGNNMRKPYSQTKALLPGDIIVLHSDGIMSRLYSQHDSAMLRLEPEYIIEYIYTHFYKDYDDASCIVYRY